MRDRLKDVIGGLYSITAERIYEPLVVHGSFRLLGAKLHALIAEQGRRAARVAGASPILDMPVGTGFFTLETARRHEGIVVGVDIARGMVEQARRAALRNEIANLSMVQADAHHLPFRDGAFGAVLCTNGLQVIPRLHETLRELHRVLGPRGTLFVSVVTLPASGLLPPDTARRLPAILQAPRELSAALIAEGLVVTTVTRDRLALLLEATTRGSSARE